MRIELVGFKNTFDEGESVVFDENEGRPVIRYFYDAGHCAGYVDILAVLDWLKTNRPDILCHVK